MPGKRVLDGLLVFLLACFLFGFGLNSRVLRRNSEARLAIVAQEAIQRGEWAVGYLNGQPRLEKPPCSSWPVALSAMAFSNGQVEARDALLPAALSGALLVLLIYWWLSGAGGEEGRVAGLLGAFFLATMVAFLGQARSAEMDIHVAFFTALAFFGLERHRLYGKQWGLPVCYLALGLGILVKAHVILVVFLPAALLWSFWRRPNAPLPARKGTWKWHLIGLALLLMVVLPWAIAFLQKSGFSFDDFWKEGVDRFDEDTGHKEPFHFYLGSIWAWTLPGVILLPFVVWHQWNRPADVTSPSRRLWWLWLVVNLVLWSFLAAKQRHYAVPWLTPVALILGQGVAVILRRADEDDAPTAARIGLRALIGLGLLLAAGAVAIPLLAPESDVPRMLLWSMSVIAAVAFVMGSMALLIRMERGFFECWWCGALCLLLLYAVTFEAAEDLASSPAGFCAQVRDAVPENATLYDADLATRRAVMIYYLRRRITPLAVREPQESYPQYFARLVPATIDKLRTEPGCYVLTFSGEEGKGGLKGELPSELYGELIPPESGFMDHRSLTAHLLRAAAPKR